MCRRVVVVGFSVRLPVVGVSVCPTARSSVSDLTGSRVPVKRRTGCSDDPHPPSVLSPDTLPRPAQTRRVVTRQTCVIHESFT